MPEQEAYAARFTPLKAGGRNKDLQVRVTGGNRSLLIRGCFGAERFKTSKEQ